MENLNTIEGTITQLKEKFTKIHSSRQDIKLIFENLDTKMRRLGDFYNELIAKNNKKMFVFGLDSFFFQNKLINLEFEQMKKLYSLVCNKIYCDYYKLYKLIISHTNDTFKDEQIFKVSENTHPKYNDLDTYKDYDMNVTQGVFLDIIKMFQTILEYVKNKELELDEYKEKGSQGLFIDNFVHSLDYNNTLLKEQLNLFMRYCTFFINLHIKYLARFVMKIKIMHGQVSNDIRLDDNALLTQKKTKKKFIKEMKEGLDKELVSELKETLDEKSGDDTTITSRPSTTETNVNMVIKETEMNQIQDYIKKGSKRHSMVLNEFNNLISGNNILPNRINNDINEIKKLQYSEEEVNFEVNSVMTNMINTISSQTHMVNM